jgi:hypothetical protein
MSHQKTKTTKEERSALLRHNSHACVFVMARVYLRNLNRYFTSSELLILGDGLTAKSSKIFTASFLTKRLSQLYVAAVPDVNQVRIIQQFMALGSKFPFVGQDDQCKENALKRFWASEEQCFQTNQRFEALDRVFDQTTDEFELINEIRRIIVSVIGSKPPIDIITQAELRFGPGSAVNTVPLKPSETTRFFKLRHPLACNYGSRSYLCALVSMHPAWIEATRTAYDLPPAIDLDSELDIIQKMVVPTFEANKITFVDKNAEMHRTIAIEPSGQGTLQMILGNFIRKSLKSKGLDLDTQQINRALARLCKTLGLCTIDLAMASDTLARLMVKCVLPPAWFQLFDLFRSSRGTCETASEPFSLTYEKFSSMGNGFTFELESMIFWAIAKATVRLSGVQGISHDYIKVFGDDIIVPSMFNDKVCENLQFFGFEINTDKSFSSGLFYESCGADYYDSQPVRPVFLKRDVKGLKDLHYVYNSLVNLSILQHRSDLDGIINYVLSKIPKKFRLYGPLHLFPSQDLYGHTVHSELEGYLACLESFIPTQNRHVRWMERYQARSYKAIQDKPIYASKVHNSEYYVDHCIRFLCFLSGDIGGRIPLRGLTRPRIKMQTSSRWDGCLTPKDRSAAYNLFHKLKV